MLAGEAVPPKPSTSTVTWREPVEVSLLSGDTPGSDNGVVSGALLQGTRSMSGSGPETPRSSPSSFGRVDSDSRKGQVEGLANSSGIPESVLIVPMEEVPTSAELGTRKVIRSRSRPRRPDEPAPFLSVDTLPVDKVVVENKTPSFKTGRPSSSRHLTGSPKKHKDQAGLNNSMNSSIGGRRTPQTPQGYGPKQSSRPNSRASSSSVNYNSFFTHKNAAFLSAGPPSLWSVNNKYWPHSASPTQKRRGPAFPPVMAVDVTSGKPNQLVTQPFKQDADAPIPAERPVSPSQDLKERTLHAVREVAKDLAMKNSPPTPTRNGRLLKGKLKPLHTFKLQGPSIDECKGIQTEERSTHTASQARMLQKKRELLSKIPPDVLQPRAMTQESIHRTSIVSNLSDDRVHDLESVMRTDDGMGTSPNQMVQMAAFTRMPPNSLASIGNSISDVAEPDDTISPFLENDSDQANEGLENGNDLFAEEPSSKLATPNLTATEADNTTQVPAPPEATMTDYLSEGGAASILLDMVDRVKHNTQRVSEEVAEAVEGVFHGSMLVNSEPPSRGSETPVYRSVVSDDGVFESASQRSVRFFDDDIEENGGITAHEDGSLSGSSIPSSRFTPTSREDLTAVAYKMTKDKDKNNDIESMNHDLLEQQMDFTAKQETQSIASVGIQMDSKHENENIADRILSTDIKVEHEAVEVTSETSEAVVKESAEDFESKSVQSVSENNLTLTPHMEDIACVVSHGQEDQMYRRQRVGQAEISEDNSDRSEHLDAKTEMSQPGVQQGPLAATRELEHETDPPNDKLSDDTSNSNHYVNVDEFEQNKDLTQSVNLPSEEQHQSEQKQTEGNRSSEQKPARAISVDLRMVSDAQNVDQVEPVQARQSAEFANQAIVDESNKSDLSKTEEQDDDEDSAQRESCNKKSDNNKEKKDDDGPDGSHGDSGGGSGGGGGSAGDGGNSDNNNDGNDGNGDHGMNMQEQSGQGDGGHGNGSKENECNDSDSAREANKAFNSNEHSEQANDAQQRTTEQKVFNSVKKYPCNRPSNHPCQHSKERVQKCWYGDLEDDVPEIEDSVLFCGVCGLDEDLCLCPHSTLAPNRTQSGKSMSASKMTGTTEAISRVALENRLMSAPGAMQNAGRSAEGKCNLSLDENGIVLEYKALLGQKESSGCYSSELSSSPQKQAQQAEPAAAHFLLRGVSVLSGDEKSSDHVDGSKVDDDVESPSGGEHLATDSSTSGNDSMPKSTEDVNEGADPNTLEVVAKPKVLSRPRSAKNKPVPVPAPFPPLCFRINVRPPAGKLFYFAYGVDMNPKRMTTYLASEVERRWGVLFGFKLKFNKRGSDLEAGGFPNIEFDPESSVEGCVYVISQAQLNALDMFMGCPQFYTHAMFPVWMSNCFQPEQFGVAQYCAPALTYVALDKWTHTDTTKPLSCHYSLEQCLKGADLLTTDYIQHMKAQLVS